MDTQLRLQIGYLFLRLRLDALRVLTVEGIFSLEYGAYLFRGSAGK